MHVDCKYETQIADAIKDIQEIHKVVCGNGKWGLTHKFDMMKWIVVILLLRFVFEIPLSKIGETLTRVFA